MDMQQGERLESPTPPQVRPTRRRFAGALGVTLMAALTLGVSSAAANSPSPEPTAAATGPGPVTTVTVGSGTVVGGSGPDAAKLDAAFAEYRDCMRDHGVDLPEPVVVSGDAAVGGPVVRTGGSAGLTEAPALSTAGLPAVDPGAFEAADTACSPILEAAGIKTMTSSLGDGGSAPVLGAGAGMIGGAAVLGGAAGAGDLETMVAPIRTYAACMREHGVAVPDPVVDESAGTFQLKLDGDPAAADFRAANAACSDGSGFGLPVPQAPAGQ